jgi:hypothetical protein
MKKEEPKQEPGKETADYIDRHIVEALVEVAKQKMYSEEELINISIQYFNHYYNISSRGRLIIDHDLKWFEQFKNK